MNIANKYTAMRIKHKNLSLKPNKLREPPGVAGVGTGAYQGLLPYSDQSHAYRLSDSLASR